MGRQYDQSGSINNGFIMNGNITSGRDSHVTVSTTTSTPDTTKKAVEEEKIKILIAANPDGSDPLRGDREWRVINYAISQSMHKDRFLLKPVMAATGDDVLLALKDIPHFLHFAGHVEGNGILLEYPFGGTQKVPVKTFAETLRSKRPALQCVFLKASQTSLLEALMAAQVSAVTMPDVIDDLLTLEFVRTFYTGIGAGNSVGEAFQASRNEAQWTGPSHNFAPRLFL